MSVTAQASKKTPPPWVGGPVFVCPSAMLDAHNGLFAATFPAPTLVQMFLVVHCLWTGVMGVLCTWDPSFSPITENGVFKRDGSKDKILHHT